jgi:hypothetical protein
MKKIFITLSAMLLIACIVKAQQPPPPRQRPSPEEHLKQVTTKLQKDLTLNDQQKVKVEAAYKTFFEGMRKLRGNSSPPPPPPLPPEKRAQAEKLEAQRDAEIKKTLSSQQFAKYKEIAKTMRPPRPPGPPLPPPNN